MMENQLIIPKIGNIEIIEILYNKNKYYKLLI